MGILEAIDAMNLSDDDKAKLRREYGEEVDPLKNDLGSLRIKDRKSTVGIEIANLSDAGFNVAPRALAFVRRLYLSPDAEEPGVVLFADHELGLTGDEATGATSREEMSVAQAFRHFFSLLPHDAEGKLKLVLSEQITEDEDHGKPRKGDNQDAAEVSAERKQSLGRSIGREVGRPSRAKRYGGMAGGE